MKKLVSPKMLFLFIIIIISTLLIFNTTNNNNITYLSLGDSYALGKDSFGINDYGYSDFLKDKLIENNQLKEYINVYSEDEMTIEKLENYIDNNKKNVLIKQKIYLKKALQEADVLTLSIGMADLKYQFLLDEDMNYSKITEELNLIEKKFDDLINKIKKYYNNDIYVIGYPNNSLDSYYLSMAIRKYNSFLRDHKDINYISVDDLEFERDKYFLNSKSNFYNKAGYKIISDKIYEKFEKNLKNN